MLTIVTLFHVLVCFALILIVLLQAGKGAEMGAAFGGASQTIFGSSGAMGFLSKLTTVAAVIFMITSLLLAFGSSQRASSIMRGSYPIQTAPSRPRPAPVQPQAPVTPAQPQVPVPEQPKK